MTLFHSVKTMVNSLSLRTNTWNTRMIFVIPLSLVCWWMLSLHSRQYSFYLFQRCICNSEYEGSGLTVWSVCQLATHFRFSPVPPCPVCCLVFGNQAWLRDTGVGLRYSCAALPQLVHSHSETVKWPLKMKERLSIKKKHCPSGRTNAHLEPKVKTFYLYLFN